jgi:hypothetical protein
VKKESKPNSRRLAAQLAALHKAGAILQPEQHLSTAFSGPLIDLDQPEKFLLFN